MLARARLQSGLQQTDVDSSACVSSGSEVPSEKGVHRQKWPQPARHSTGLIGSSSHMVPHRGRSGPGPHALPTSNPHLAEPASQTTNSPGLPVASWWWLPKWSSKTF